VQHDAAVDYPAAVDEMYSRVGAVDVTPTASGLAFNVDGFGQQAHAKKEQFAPREALANSDDEGSSTAVLILVYIVVIAFVVFGGFYFVTQLEVARANPEAYVEMQEVGIVADLVGER
jgi:hypothetical protein